MTQSLLIPSPQGTTRLFAVLGDPVGQVQAPVLLNRLFLELNADAVTIPVHVRPGQLKTVVEGLKRMENLDGIVITIPHKFAICSHADRVSTTVGLAGSANVLRRDPDGSWFAENLDGLGFVQGLRAQAHEPAGKLVALFGAGGAGAAIATALVQAGVSRVMLTDTLASRADDLADRLNAYKPEVAISLACPTLNDVDMAINASPVGLNAHDPIPFPIDDLPQHAIVTDIIMKPAETRLLKCAVERGLKTHPGIHMLTPQIQLYAEFFGVTRPVHGNC